MYSDQTQTVRVLVQGNNCLNNETWDGHNCTVPMTDLSQAVTLNPLQRQYYRLQLNNTEMNDPASYVMSFTLNVTTMTTPPSSPSLSQVIMKRDLKSNDTMINMVGRWNGVPSLQYYDFFSNLNHTEMYPKSGTWDFYVENLNNITVTIKVSLTVSYCDVVNTNAPCIAVTAAPTNLIFVTIPANSSMYYSYASSDSSLMLGATSEQIIPVATVQATYNRFPSNIDDHDIQGCTQQICTAVTQTIVPATSNPGVWYVAIRNPTSTPMTTSLWFYSQCAPLCTIKGQCHVDGQCKCIAKMYTGIDCNSIDDHLMTYVPLIIAGGVLFLLLLIAAFLGCTCQIEGYSSIQ